MNIRLATKEDIRELNKMFKLVISDLVNVKKIDMLWNDDYPFCMFENDILNKEMYIMEINSSIIGSFVLSKYDNPNYNDIKWTCKNKKVLYLNRLAVLPSKQGRGYAKEAMKFIENYSINNNYKVIRLTVYEGNKYAIGLYEKLGFKKVEKGNFKLEDKIYIGYEKNIEYFNL